MLTREGAGEGDYYLMSGGKLLAPTKTIQENGLEDMNSVQVRLRLRGGMQFKQDEDSFYESDGESPQQ